MNDTERSPEHSETVEDSSIVRKKVGDEAFSGRNTPAYRRAHIKIGMKTMAGHGTPFQVLSQRARIQNWQIADWVLTPIIPHLYESFESKKYLTVGVLCKQMRVVVPKTSRDYLWGAEREGLLRIEPSARNRKEKVAKPTRKLCALVEKRVSEIVTDYRSSIGEMLDDGAFPIDGIVALEKTTRLPDFP